MTREKVCNVSHRRRESQLILKLSMYPAVRSEARCNPLVRITNTATGKVMYARTHSFSTMGVATGAKLVGAQFDVPSTIGLGGSTLEVLANGIPSAAIAVVND